MAHTQYFPPALASRLKGIAATNPADIEDPQRASQVFNQQVEVLSLTLNAIRRNPSMATNIRGDLDPTTAFLVREAERISRTEAVSAEDVLRRLHDEFPKDVRQAIGRFDMEAFKGRVNNRSVGIAGGWAKQVQDAVDGIDAHTFGFVNEFLGIEDDLLGYDPAGGSVGAPGGLLTL